ncbi:MAG: 4-hydroxy-tetrahydrodipicolinate reductase [Coriobacteriales bacterium]|jgi:4-hydroxy-tetrahydrodipicolinate reductase|nr:4-hydroxy-tetrahydrodipicolinate reductase [Coriobacteriales bacterium]
MIKVVVSGFAGRMGNEVLRAIQASNDIELAGGYDPAVGTKTSTVMLDGTAIAPAFRDLGEALESVRPDVVVDFSVPSAVEQNIRTCVGHGIDCVIGTTGLSSDALEALSADIPSGTAVFVAPNFTTGAVLMMAFAQAAAAYFPDAEVIELHHNRKADAPSGTALMTARNIAQAQRRAGVTSGAPGKETELPGAEGARGACIDGVPVHSVRSNGFVASQEVVFGSPGQTLTIRHDSIDRTAYMPGVLLAIRSVAGLSGLVVGLDQLMDLGFGTVEQA